MNWFHMHKWALVSIFNDQGYDPRPEIGAHHSHWVYECRVCGIHKQKTFNGHFSMPDKQKEKELAELNKMMGAA